MLYRDIEELWAEIADDVDGYQVHTLVALLFFIVTSPLWFPVWLVSKIINKLKKQ
jgi:hypothetical protein